MPLESTVLSNDAVCNSPINPQGIHKAAARWTHVTKFALFLAISAVMEAVISAITGEKTIFLFKEQLHLSATQLASFGLILGIPSYIQPFAGAWTDVFPLFGFHRKSYYLVGTVGTALAFGGLAIMHSYHLGSILCLVLLSGSFAIFAAVVTNAVMVSIGNSTGNFGRFQSLIVFVPYMLKLGFTSHLGGFVAQHWSYQAAFGTAAALGLLLAPLVCLMEEKRADLPEEIESNIQRRMEREIERKASRALLRDTLKMPGLWATLAFVFYLNITPLPNTTYFFTDGLHLSKLFVGDNGRWSAAGALIGMALFAMGNRRLPVISLVVGAWITDCLIYPVEMMMHGPTSVHVMTLMNAVMGVVFGLCLNTIAARACPRGIEASIYGMAMAAIVLAVNVCNLLGNGVYDYFGPAHHHTVVHGWNASLLFGLVFTLPAGLLIPFMPAALKSRRQLRDGPDTLSTTPANQA